MALSDQDKLDIQNAVEPIITAIVCEASAEILTQIERMNCKFAEMLSAVFTERAGSVMGEIMQAHKKERERIEIESAEYVKNRKKPGFANAR